MRIIPIILALLLLTLSWVSPVSAANQLDVVINEIAWMGTTASSNDEWIELYNTTNSPITLDGWILEAEDGTPKIDLLGTINPKSYYLLKRTNNNTISDITADLIYSGALSNTGEKLLLKSSSNIVIDQINALPEWFAGDNSTKSTMERINPLDPGDNPTNWATNNGSKRNGIDEDGNQINGTPNSQNSAYLVTPTPALSASSTPTPAPSLSISPTPKPTSAFTISNIPSQISADQSFNVSVNLTLPNNKNTDYYLSGAFKKTDGTRYFGLTSINSNWVPYNSSNYINQYKITTDGNGNWTGTLEAKLDTEDSDYKGSGEYIFKVARYLSNSNPTWSNESTIKIIFAEDNQDEISTNIPSSATPPLQIKTSVPSSTKNYERLVYRIASVAAATASAKTATPGSSIKIKDQRQINPIIWIGVIFIFAGVGAVGYIYFRKNAKIHF